MGKEKSGILKLYNNQKTVITTASVENMTRCPGFKRPGRHSPLFQSKVMIHHELLFAPHKNSQ